MAQAQYSLHRELGIMFGFLAACILTVAVYYIFWQAIQRRAAARDEARRKDLRARGFHHERGGYHDKALHRYASRDPIAQSQGQTLEFLTAPDQFQDVPSNDDINDYIDISDHAQQQHYNGGAGAGLRINSAVRSKKRDHEEQDHIESAVSYQTPSSIHHEIGAGQSAKDLF